MCVRACHRALSNRDDGDPGCRTGFGVADNRPLPEITNVFSPTLVRAIQCQLRRWRPVIMQPATNRVKAIPAPVILRWSGDGESTGLTIIKQNFW